MNNDFLYYNKNNEYIIKMPSNLTMKNIKNISKFIDELIEKKLNIIFEMSDVSYMDSTFLGLIAKTSIDLKVNLEKKLKIINPSLEALKYLKQTGILKFLDIIEKREILEINLNKVENSKFENNDEKSRFILEMHEILMNLNDENYVEFKPVVDAMRKVIK